MFALYTDAELDALIEEVKAAIPQLLAGGEEVTVGSSHTKFTSLASLEAFATRLAREKARRDGTAAPRTIAVRRRPDAWRGHR